MAVFTNQSDTKLPALTQFYQLAIGERSEGETDLAYGRRLLNTPAGEELRLWVVRVAGLDESESEGRLPNAFLTACSGLSVGAGESFQTSVFLGDSLKSGEEFIVWLSDLHFFFAYLMNCAADDRPPHRDQVKRLNELLALYAPPKVVWHAAMHVPDASPEIQIELDTVDLLFPDFIKTAPPFIGTTESLEQFVGRLLVREFYRALTRRQLARCRTCEAVYWRENPKSVSCSRRCASRQAQRLWKKRRAEDNR